MQRVLALAMILISTMARAAAGEIKEIDAYLTPAKADEYIGMEYRANVVRAGQAAQRGDGKSAWAALEDVLAFCDEQKSTDVRRIYSVHNDAEAKQYRDEAGDGVTTTFVDQACPTAYKQAAFLSVREGRNEAALGYLDRAEALSPHWAEPVAERAYLVGKLGDRNKSLALYRQALEKVERYRSSAYLKPLVLRGIGFALTELGRLQEAREAYEASLRIEPDNALAKNELAYLDRLQANAAGGK